MKSLRVFIILMSALLCIALALGVYVWYELQNYHASIKQPATDTLIRTQIDTTSKSPENVVE